MQNSPSIVLKIMLRETKENGKLWTIVQNGKSAY